MADKPVVYRNRGIDSTIGTTNEVDFSRDLTLDYESEVPLLALTNRLKSARTFSHIYKFAVGRFAPRTSPTTAAVTATAVGVSATIPVTNGEYFNVGAVVEVPSINDDATHTSQLYITAVSGNNLTARPYKPGTFGVSAIADGATVRYLFTATEEGSEGTPAHQTVPTVYEQYVQIFEDYFRVTNIQDLNRQYTDPERSRLREEKRKKHAIDQELAMYYALKVQDTSTSGAPRYQMDGLDAQIKENITTYGAQLIDTELYAAMMDIHSPAYSGGDKRLVLASASVLSDVNKMSLTAIRISTKETTWGPNITQIQFAGFNWGFVHAPMITQTRDGDAFIIHPMFIRKRWMQQSVLRQNVQVPKANYVEDGFITISSVEVRLSEVFGKLRK